MYTQQRGLIYTQPIFQREALWINLVGSGDCAIKVSVGGPIITLVYCQPELITFFNFIGINAISGLPRDQTPTKPTQDYAVGGKQPWLDGISITICISNQKDGFSQLS